MVKKSDQNSDHDQDLDRPIAQVPKNGRQSYDHANEIQPNSNVFSIRFSSLFIEQVGYYYTGVKNILKQQHKGLNIVFLQSTSTFNLILISNLDYRIPNIDSRNGLPDS